MREASGKTYTELIDLCVWTKTNAGMGSFYRSQHELVFVFKNGGAPHVNGVKRGSRDRSSVWRYSSVDTLGDGRNAQPGTAVKPLALIADAILDCSKRGAIVLDAFAGSGSTLLAAERTGRRGVGIELKPHYVTQSSSGSTDFTASRPSTPNRVRALRRWKTRV